MTFQLLDVAPIDDSYIRQQVQKQREQEYQKWLKEQELIKQAEQEEYNKLSPKEKKLMEKAERMAEKARKKAEKAQRKAREKAEKARKKAEKKAKKQSTSSTYSPFSTKDNVNELSTQQGQTFTTQPVFKAGFGFDTDNSSMLLSSIMIVGAALLVCLSGALIYRNKTNKQDK